jgi:hypothetical protein
MVAPVDETLLQLFDHLPEPVREARAGVTRAIRNGTYGLDMIELVRLRSAGLHGCRH